MKKKIILKKYKRERDSELATTCKQVVGGMVNNPKFTDPPEELVKLEELHPRYHDSVVKAKKRDKEMVAIKKAMKAEVVVLLTALDSYVTRVCNGDEAMLISSGFDISGQNPDKATPVIDKLNVVLGTPGEVTISIKSVRGARAYLHQYTTEPPTSETVWTNAGTTNTKHTFKGLKSFTKYWFRIGVLFKDAEPVYSPVDARIIQ